MRWTQPLPELYSTAALIRGKDFSAAGIPAYQAPLSVPLLPYSGSMSGLPAAHGCASIQRYQFCRVCWAVFGVVPWQGPKS